MSFTKSMISETAGTPYTAIQADTPSNNAP